MANEELKISIVARADQAEAEMKALSKLADELTDDELQIVVKAKTDAAEAEVKRLTKLMEGLSDPVDIKVAAAGITAAKSQLDDLRSLAERPMEAEVDIRTDKARQGIDDIGKSADSSKSVLANMVGNATQDLGVLGGVAGSAGVAIGQMGEYMADAAAQGEGMGSILKNFAGVIGPIALLSVGVGIATSAFANMKKKVEEVEKANADALKRMREQFDVIDSFQDRLAQAKGFSIQEALFGDMDEGDLSKLSEGLANAGTDVDHLFASLEKGSGSTQGFITDLIKTNDAAQRVGATYGITDARLAEVIATTDNAGDAVTALAGDSQQLLEALAADEGFVAFLNNVESIEDTFDEIDLEGQAKKLLNDMLSGISGPELQRLAEGFKKMFPEEDSIQILQRVSVEYAKVGASLDQVTRKVQQAEVIKEILDDVGISAEEFGEAMDTGMSKADQALTGADVSDSARDVAEALKKAFDPKENEDRVNKFVAPFDRASEAFRDVDEAVVAFGESMDAELQSMVEQGITDVPTLTARLAEMRQEFIDQAVAAGLTTEQAEAYVDTLERTPESIATAVNLAIQQDATERLDNLLILMEALENDGLPREARIAVITELLRGTTESAAAEAEFQLSQHAPKTAVALGIDPTEAIANRQEFVKDTEAIKPDIPLHANSRSAEDVADDYRRSQEGDDLVIPLDGDIDAAAAAADTFRDTEEGNDVDIPVDVNTSPAEEALRVFRSIRRTITIFANTIFGGSGTSAPSTNNGSRGGGPDTFAVGIEPLAAAGEGDNALPGDTPGSTYGVYIPPSVRARGGDGGIGTTINVTQYLPAGTSPSQVVEALRRAERRNGAVSTRLIVQPSRFGSV